MSCGQGPSGRACWQRGHQSKSFPFLSQRALESIHLIPTPLPCLLSSVTWISIFWRVNPCSACSHNDDSKKWIWSRHSHLHLHPHPFSDLSPPPEQASLLQGNYGSSVLVSAPLSKPISPPSPCAPSMLKYISTKTCSTSYVIRKMQITIATRYHHTPVRMAQIWTADSTNCWGGGER